MKKQKKIIYTAVIGVLATVCASSVLAGVNNLHTADAAVIEQPVYSDDFNAKEISDNWMATDAKIVSEYSSLRVQPDEYAWPGHILCQGYKLDGDCRLEMTVRELPMENSSWFAMSFGSPSTVSIFEKASGALIFSYGTTLLFREGADTGRSFAYSPKMEKPSTVVLDFVKQPEFGYDITYTLKQDGEVLGTSLIEDFVVQDGYFGFNTYNTNFDILSFDVYEGEQKVYADDFSTSVMSHDDNIVKGSEWVALSPFTSKSAAIAPIGQLDISKAGAGVVYKDPFTKTTAEVSTLYELSAQLDFSNAQVGVATGFEIAKPSADADGVFVGLVRQEQSYKMVLSTEDKTEELILGGNPANGLWNFSVAAKYDNAIEVTANNFTTTFELDGVEGYFGITTSDKYEKNGTGALVDDFSYQRYIYNDSGAKDMAINFEGTREYEDADGKYYQYYFSSKDWKTGSNVRLANYGFAKNGYILFGNSSPDSSFGPKVKYGDCIVRFDITLVGGEYYYDHPDTYYDTPTGAGACDAECFGLQFGAKSYQNIYVNVQSLGIATYNSKSVYYTTNCTRSLNSDDLVYRPNTEHIPENEYDLFKKSATYNFMYIIKNGTVSMHFKEESEDESVLGIVREYVTDVETNGYLAVYGANGVDFRLDNLSITSLDRTYTSSEYAGDNKDLQTLRVDTTKGDDLSAFEMSANSLTTKAVTGSNITRVTLGDVNGLTYKQGDMQITFAEKSATVSDGVNVQKMTFNTSLLLKGATVEISRIGDTVTIGYANAGAPLSAIDENTYSVSGFKSAGREQITLSTNGNMQVTKISIFNLDSKVTIQPRNFDASLDVVQPWVERESIQGKKMNVLLYVLIGVGAAAVIAVVTVLIIRRKKKDDNAK